jgi:hypothetical protein
MLFSLCLLIALPAFADGQPQLLLFWRGDCAPCRHEMDALPDLLAAAPDAAVKIVSLEDVKSTQRDLPHLPARVSVEYMSPETAHKLAFMANTAGALPFSIMLHADGTVCARQLGILGTLTLQHWSKQC